MDHLCFRIEPFDRDAIVTRLAPLRDIGRRNGRALRCGRHRTLGLFPRSGRQPDRTQGSAGAFSAWPAAHDVLASPATGNNNTPDDRVSLGGLNMRTRLAFIAGSLAAFVAVSAPAFAQKQGGTLRISHRDNPPSASIHEEATISVNQPFMAVFNNLVMFDPEGEDQQPRQDRARSGRELVVERRQDASSPSSCASGVKWHDGKPFSAKDVKCTWDALTGKGDEKHDMIRKNPRKVWYNNLKEVTTNGDNEVTFTLERGRSLRSCRCSPPATRRSIPATSTGRDDALQADRHRPVQGRRLQAQRSRSSWCAIPTTGRRAGPISTPSTARSCPTAAPACWASSPANST